MESTMDKVYVVVGNSGEHDDAREWVVGASLDIAVAMARTEALNDIARSFGGLMSEIGPSLTNAQTKLLQQKLEAGSDESGECPDYNGVEYVCRAAPLWKQ
jgi:hypothetical protein